MKKITIFLIFAILFCINIYSNDFVQRVREYNLYKMKMKILLNEMKDENIRIKQKFSKLISVDDIDEIYNFVIKIKKKSNFIMLKAKSLFNIINKDYKDFLTLYEERSKFDNYLFKNKRKIDNIINECFNHYKELEKIFNLINKRKENEKLEKREIVFPKPIFISYKDPGKLNSINQSERVIEIVTTNEIRSITAIFSKKAENIGPIGNFPDNLVEHLIDINGFPVFNGTTIDGYFKMHNKKVDFVSYLDSPEAFLDDAGKLFTDTHVIREYLKMSDIKINSKLKKDIYLYEKKDINYETSSEVKFHLNKRDKIDFKFNKNSNLYERKIDGKFQKDNGNNIFASSIAVQFVNGYKTKNKDKNLKLDLISEGKAKFYIGGKEFLGKWFKHKDGLTQFAYENGKTVYFNKGKIWHYIVVNVIKEKKDGKNEF